MPLDEFNRMTGQPLGSYRTVLSGHDNASLRKQPVWLYRGDDQYGDTHDCEPAVCPDKLRVDLCRVRDNQAAVRREARENIHERGAESGHGVSCLVVLLIIWILSKWSLTLVFALPGVLVLLMTVWMTFQPELKVFSASLTNAEAEG